MLGRRRVRRGRFGGGRVGGGGTGLASASSLASTGSGIDVTLWAAVGIGLVLLGMILMVLLPGSRRRGRADVSTTSGATG